MQGVHGWIGPLDIVFAAYCCGIFVPASFVFLGPVYMEGANRATLGEPTFHTFL